MIRNSALIENDVKPQRQTRRPRSRLVARAARFLTLVATAGSIVGCAEINPRFELRDDYMFKRFLQPDRVVGEVKRDELGNPILPDSSPEQ